jgi:hypothetical protein
VTTKTFAPTGSGQLRAVRGGARRAQRGWSMPLIAIAFDDDDEPCSARRRAIAQAAHVRPRCICRPNAGLCCAARLPTIRSAARASLRYSSTPQARRARTRRATSATAASWAAPRSDARPFAEVGRWRVHARDAVCVAGREAAARRLPARTIAHLFARVATSVSRRGRAVRVATTMQIAEPLKMTVTSFGFERRITPGFDTQLNHLGEFNRTRDRRAPVAPNDPLKNTVDILIECPRMPSLREQL